MTRPSRRLAAAALAWLTAAPFAAAAPAALPTTGPTTAPTTEPAPTPPDFSAQTQSVRVPFARTSTTHPLNFENLRGMYVRVSVNGGPPLSMLVDTGSDGVILGAADVPNIDPKAPPGEMVYSSSGYGLYGVWTPVTIAFLDAKDADGNVPVAHCPILAARESRVVSTTAPNAKGFKPSKDPRPHMFGIGFGRGNDPHPERNPFLTLEAMRAGTMRRGYTITRDGFTLGLTKDGVGPGYFYQRLKERTVAPGSAAIAPGMKDWQTSRGWVTVNSVRMADVPILVDTGLSNFFIPVMGLPDTAEANAGCPITVDLLGGQVHYSFTVGDKADPAAPNRVTYTVGRPTSNVNTGLRALAIYDYLYDADGGYLGLRPTVPAHP